VARGAEKWVVAEIAETEQKGPSSFRAEYEEALTWDQLKSLMRNPHSNPFSGFEESPINFPPTFKVRMARTTFARGLTTAV
jgi:hypothetical protein